MAEIAAHALFSFLKKDLCLTHSCEKQSFKQQHLLQLHEVLCSFALARANQVWSGSMGFGESRRPIPTPDVDFTWGLHFAI